MGHPLVIQWMRLLAQASRGSRMDEPLGDLFSICAAGVNQGLICAIVLYF